MNATISCGRPAATSQTPQRKWLSVAFTRIKDVPGQCTNNKALDQFLPFCSLLATHPENKDSHIHVLYK